MPKLESLCIYQCFLLNLSDTAALVSTMNAINEKRREANQPRVVVDFSPFYYKGPPHKAEGSGHVGEFGAAPEEIPHSDSTRDVTAQLLKIWKLCHDGGQDFFTPGTGFRAFLDRLPIRTLPSILVSIKAIHDFEKEVDRLHKEPFFLGKDKQMKEAMKYTVWQRLILSCHGEPILKRRVDALLLVGKSPEVKLAYCRPCQLHLTAYFFKEDDLNSLWGDEPKCCGCRWAEELRPHQWRAQYERRKLAEAIYSKSSGEKLKLKQIVRGKRPRNETAATRGHPDELLAIMGNPFILDGAWELWNDFTVLIPHELRVIRRRAELGRQDPNDYSRVENLEFCIGKSQHIYMEGPLRDRSSSWETNIQDFRAELAVKHGLFTNQGPVPIFDYVKNVATMLGNEGGLRQYWLPDWESHARARLDREERSRRQNREEPPRRRNREERSRPLDWEEYCRQDREEHSRPLDWEEHCRQDREENSRHLDWEEHCRRQNWEEPPRRLDSEEPSGYVPPHLRRTRHAAPQAQNIPSDQPPTNEAPSLAEEMLEWISQPVPGYQDPIAEDEDLITF